MSCKFHQSDNEIRSCRYARASFCACSGRRRSVTPNFFFEYRIRILKVICRRRKSSKKDFLGLEITGPNLLLTRQIAPSQYGQLALGKYFCKTKNLNRVSRFDVIANFLLSKSEIWARLAHWPRRGALCGQSKGGDSMSRFSGKIYSSYAESVHEMPHSTSLEAPLGALGCPGTGVPVRKGELLAATFFDTKVLHFCTAV